jgi:hypothetical protein
VASPHRVAALLGRSGELTHAGRASRLQPLRSHRTRRASSTTPCSARTAVAAHGRESGTSWATVSRAAVAHVRVRRARS